MLWKYIPFTSHSQSLVSSFMQQSGQDWEQHEKRLENILQSWGFSRVTVPGSGDCFFISITLGLLSQSTQAEHLKTRDIDFTQDVPVIVSKLRKIMVDELLQNKHVYEYFFPALLL